MRMFTTIVWPLACYLVLSCVSSSHTVRDVSELMPPTAVDVDRAAGSMVITWQPSPDTSLSDFAGYHVYVAARSLVMVPADNLPAPIAVEENQHSARVDTLDPKARYFVHVRSKLKGGGLSLPSLPEIIVGPDEPKNP